MQRLCCIWLLMIASVILFEFQAFAQVTDLRVAKSNNVAGSVKLGDSFQWTYLITNQNDADIDAEFVAGDRIFVDDLPAGANYSISQNISTFCSIIAGPTLECTASGAGLMIPFGSSETIIVSVSPTATGTLENPRAAGICRVDPDDTQFEFPQDDDDCNADTVNVIAPDLEVETKTNNVSGVVIGGGSFEWRITINNIGSADADFAEDDIIFSDQVPSNATYSSITIENTTDITGTITCEITLSQFLECIANGGSVTIGATTGTFQVVINVTAPFFNGDLNNPSQQDECLVDPDDLIVEIGEVMNVAASGNGAPSNNYCPSNTVTVQTPDLSVEKGNDASGSVLTGESFNWEFTFENFGNAPTVFSDGEIIFEDQLPDGAEYEIVPAIAAAQRVRAASTTPINGLYDCTIEPGNVAQCVAGPGDFTIFGMSGPVQGFEVMVTPTITAGTLTNPTGGVCRIDPDNVIGEENDELNGTDNNDCSDTVIVEPPLNKLATPESVRVTQGFNIPFWCGEHKDEFTMDGVDFVNLEQYETEIEVIFPQKRILGIIPLPQAVAQIIETATITDPANFQTPGDMTLPVRGTLSPGKTIRIHCSDITTLPTRLDENDDIVEILSQLLSDEEYFHGIFTLESSISDLRVFVNKIVRSWKGVDQGSGLDFVDSQLDRERTEITGTRVSNTHDVLYEIDDNPAPPVPPLQVTTSSDWNRDFEIQSIQNRAIRFSTLNASTIDFAVEIYGLNGQQIFSALSHGQSLVWNMKDEMGQLVANGVYLYVISSRDAAGNLVRSEVRKLVLIR